MKREFTATVYIVDEQKVLLLFHPKLQKWLPPGGHLEEGETPPSAAKREVLEETGLDIEFIRQENLWINRFNAKSIERPYLCLLENVPKWQDVPEHQHIDFIFVAKPKEKSLLKKDPPPLLRWFTLEEVMLLAENVMFKETQETLYHLLNQQTENSYVH